MGDLPLAAASIRLRGKPGRPRKNRIETSLAVTNKTAANGAAASKTGTLRAQSPPSDQVNSGSEGRQLAISASTLPPFASRLLGLSATASYLGLASWTVRELEWRGVLRRVRVPLPNGGELRKLLFDRVDLDGLIERWKDLPSALESGGVASSAARPPVGPGALGISRLTGVEQALAANGAQGGRQAAEAVQKAAR